MTRTGAAWDGLALAALLAPLAGLAAPVAGLVSGGGRAAGRRAVARAGRWGSLAACLAWVVVLSAGAAPQLGGFAPDRLAAAAAAGSALLAAVVTLDPPARSRARLDAVLAPPAAALSALLVGSIDAPSDLGRFTATAMVLVGAVIAAAAAFAAVDRALSPRLPLAIVGIGPAMFLVLRGAAQATDPVAPVGLAALAAAVALAAAATRRPARRAFVTGAGCLLVAATALGPVEAARPWAPLVAAGVVLVATDIGRWTRLALAPGILTVGAALADVPAPGAPAAFGHVLFAVGVLVLVVAVVVAQPPPGEAPVGAEVGVAVSLLTAWLVLAPGSWRWAVADPAALVAWDRAAAAAAAAAIGTGVLVAAARRPDRAATEAARYP